MGLYGPAQALGHSPRPTRQEPSARADMRDARTNDVRAQTGLKLINSFVRAPAHRPGRRSTFFGPASLVLPHRQLFPLVTHPRHFSVLNRDKNRATTPFRTQRDMPLNFQWDLLVSSEERFF